MNVLSVGRSKTLIVTAFFGILVGCNDNGGSSNADIARLVQTFSAEVRRTTHGIPHIKSTTWTGLGLGYGYAYAQDNVCLFGREMLRVNGELSRYFGPGDGNVESDFVHKYYGRSQFIDTAFGSLRPEIQQLLEGYAMGYNRYLRDTGVDGLPADCRGAEWIREISVQDMYQRTYSVQLRAGVTNPSLRQFIANAAPPEPTSPKLAPVDIKERLEVLQAAPGFGSNAYGLGREVTESGRGLLLGNPHFSWITSERFYQAHLTIPGIMDVMGASISVTPVLAVGFTRNFAWTHTVSTAQRFTVYELELVAGDPTSYRFDGKREKMLAEDFTVKVLQPDGSLIDETRTLYTTRFGPMISIWTEETGFTVRDANVENDRFANQYFRMNTAKDLDDFIASQREVIGVPLFNTVAVSADGRAYYADMTVVPNVDEQKQLDCPPFTSLGESVESFGLFVLDGRRSECDWEDDPAAPQPGIFPAPELPTLERTDYVSNSNNSYWYTNPNQPLTGFAPIIGSEETPLSGRQRVSFIQIDERLGGSDGFGGDRFNIDNLQQILFANRSGRGELVVDGVVAICSIEPNELDLDGETIDVSEACAVLANWDRTTNRESVGDHVFREFWRTAMAIENLYVVSFDPSDPVNTPNTVNVGDATVRSEVMLSLARSTKTLGDNGIPLTAKLGDIQFTETSVGPIAIHGGSDVSGSYNVITGDSITPGLGYTPIVHGTSYIQTVTFDDRGPVAEGLLSYSQSTNPDSPLSYDQTLLYSNKQWVKLPFYDEDILSDPNFSVTRLWESVPLF